MDLKIIKNILNLISESDVNEVSIEEGDFKIKVKKQKKFKKGTEIIYEQQIVCKYCGHRLKEKNSVSSSDG